MDRTPFTQTLLDTSGQETGTLSLKKPEVLLNLSADKIPEEYRRDALTSYQQLTELLLAGTPGTKVEVDANNTEFKANMAGRYDKSWEAVTLFITSDLKSRELISPESENRAIEAVLQQGRIHQAGATMHGAGTRDTTQGEHAPASENASLAGLARSNTTEIS